MTSLVPAAALGVAGQVRTLTGAHTRVAWCQPIVSHGHTQFRLMGLDSDDGRGVHTILRGLPSCEKPLITPSGSRIVFSDRSKDQVYVVNWNGKELHSVVQGYATDVWKEPKTGTEHVYVRVGRGKMDNGIIRYEIDHPQVSQLIWDKTPLDAEQFVWFQVSANGTRACAAFPWPNCGIADLGAASWELRGPGCWPSIAPDNSYRTFHFDGGHKSITMYDDGGANPRVIPLSGAPGVQGKTVFYPRWSHNPRFMTMTGPGYNNEAELYLGRFNPQFTAVERWVKVTHNAVPDHWGDAWIEPSAAAQLTGSPTNAGTGQTAQNTSSADALSATPPGASSAAVDTKPTVQQAAAPNGQPAIQQTASPKTPTILKIRARLLEKSAVPSPTAIAPYYRALVAYRYSVQAVLAGSFRGKQIRVFHWGLIDRKPLPFTKARVGKTMVLELEPLDENPQLQSEYQSDTLHTVGGAYYYDIAGASLHG